MPYIGDFTLGSTLDVKFTTVDVTGAPITLAGTPVVSAYPDNSLTQLTAGITLTVDFDAVTGLHNVRVVATGANGYATATNYALVITTGTVDSVSVVGYVVAQFSIEARSALRPTTSGRTLDVSAGGEAGLDWANVGTPGSTVSLSATTVATVTTTTTATNLTNAATSGDLTATMKASVNTEVDTALDTVIPAVNTANSVNDILLDQLSPRLPASGTLATTVSAVGSVTGAVGSVTGAVGSVAAGGITTASFATGAITAAVIADGAIDAATFAAGAIDAAAIAANAIGASELAQDAAQEIADEVLNRDIVGGASGGTRNVRNALRVLRNRVGTVGTTLTVYMEDDLATAWTAVATRTASTNPLTDVDPV